MEDISFWRSHVPAFGSWDQVEEYEHLPYSQCFEMATKDKVCHRSYSKDRDFFISSKFLNNGVVASTPMIVLPHPMENAHYCHVKDTKKEGLVMCAMKQPHSSVLAKPRKPVDEDLYRISPEILRFKPKKLSAMSFFSMCLGPCASCQEI